MSTDPNSSKRSKYWDTWWTAKKGFHNRMTTQLDGENHEVIPNHDPIKTGTLSGILKHVAVHHGLSVEDLLLKIDLW